MLLGTRGTLLSDAANGRPRSHGPAPVAPGTRSGTLDVRRATTGSADGWKPSKFVSSRDRKRARDSDSPEAAVSFAERVASLTDAHDDALLGRVLTTGAHGGQGVGMAPHARAGLPAPLAALLEGPAEASAGADLMKAMGWRPGKGLGPGRRRAAGPGGAVVVVPPDDVAAAPVALKLDRRGLGYDDFGGRYADVAAAGRAHARARGGLTSGDVLGSAGRWGGGAIGQRTGLGGGGGGGGEGGGAAGRVAAILDGTRAAAAGRGGTSLRFVVDDAYALDDEDGDGFGGVGGGSTLLALADDEDGDGAAAAGDSPARPSGALRLTGRQGAGGGSSSQGLSGHVVYGGSDDDDDDDDDDASAAAAAPTVGADGRPALPGFAFAAPSRAARGSDTAPQPPPGWQPDTSRTLRILAADSAGSGSRRRSVAHETAAGAPAAGAPAAGAPAAQPAAGDPEAEPQPPASEVAPALDPQAAAPAAPRSRWGTVDSAEAPIPGRNPERSEHPIADRSAELIPAEPKPAEPKRAELDPAEQALAEAAAEDRRRAIATLGGLFEEGDAEPGHAEPAAQDGGVPGSGRAEGLGRVSGAAAPRAPATMVEEPWVPAAIVSRRLGLQPIQPLPRPEPAAAAPSVVAASASTAEGSSGGGAREAAAPQPSTSLGASSSVHSGSAGPTGRALGGSASELELAQEAAPAARDVLAGVFGGSSSESEEEDEEDEDENEEDEKEEDEEEEEAGGRGSGPRGSSSTTRHRGEAAAPSPHGRHRQSPVAVARPEEAGRRDRSDVAGSALAPGLIGPAKPPTLPPGQAGGAGAAVSSAEQSQGLADAGRFDSLRRLLRASLRAGGEEAGDGAAADADAEVESGGQRRRRHHRHRHGHRSRQPDAERDSAGRSRSRRRDRSRDGERDHRSGRHRRRSRRE